MHLPNVWINHYYGGRPMQLWNRLEIEGGCIENPSIGRCCFMDLLPLSWIDFSNMMQIAPAIVSATWGSYAMRYRLTVYHNSG